MVPRHQDNLHIHVFIPVYANARWLYV